MTPHCFPLQGEPRRLQKHSEFNTAEMWSTSEMLSMPEVATFSPNQGTLRVEDGFLGRPFRESLELPVAKAGRIASKIRRAAGCKRRPLPEGQPTEKTTCSNCGARLLTFSFDSVGNHPESRFAANSVQARLCRVHILRLTGDTATLEDGSKLRGKLASRGN